jgi:hypothetical protein
MNEQINNDFQVTFEIKLIKPILEFIKMSNSSTARRD